MKQPNKEHFNDQPKGDTSIWKIMKKCWNIIKIYDHSNEMFTWCFEYICLLFRDHLPKTWRATIRQNMMELTLRLHPDEIALRLYASNMLTYSELENIRDMETESKKSDYIIDLLFRGSRQFIIAFYEVNTLYWAYIKIKRSAFWIFSLNL